MESEREGGLASLAPLPALGSMPVAKGATRDVARLHLDLPDKPGTGNRAVQMVKAFFYWLERSGLFSGVNPARNIELYAENPRERLLTVEEMALAATPSPRLPTCPKVWRS
jgi:hypothetical protein